MRADSYCSIDRCVGCRFSGRTKIVSIRFLLCSFLEKKPIIQISHSPERSWDTFISRGKSSRDRQVAENDWYESYRDTSVHRSQAKNHWVLNTSSSLPRLTSPPRWRVKSSRTTVRMFWTVLSFLKQSKWNKRDEVYAGISSDERRKRINHKAMVRYDSFHIFLCRHFFLLRSTASNASHITTKSMESGCCITVTLW